MHDIDFLPADYVCVRTTRKNNNWLRGLFAVVLGLMALGWAAQRQSLAEKLQRRDRLKQQTTALLAKLGSPDALRSELKQVESQCRLRDVLELSVPPSRWLSAIVAVLPSQVSLREIRTSLEEIADPSIRPTPNRGAAKPQDEPIGDPLERDLDRLAQSAERHSLVISLTGTAADDLAVSDFLNALQRIGLFDRVQLLFTDQLKQGEYALRSFALRLHVRPVPGRTTDRTSPSNESRRPPITQRREIINETTRN